MTILEVLGWLESTAVAVLVQESAYGFPLAVALHLLGLTLSVGTLIWVDLRMLGVTLPHLRLTEVYRSLAPWFLAGFAVMFASGAVLFTAFATSAYGNVYFRIKIAALLLAGINALVFHLVIERQRTTANDALRPSPAVRLAGISSIVLWATVIVSGRMMSYTMFSYG